MFRNYREFLALLGLLLLSFLLLICVPLLAEAQETSFPDIGLRIENAAATKLAAVMIHSEVSKLDDPSKPSQKFAMRKLKKIVRSARAGDYDAACAQTWGLVHRLRRDYGFPTENEPLWDALDTMLFLHCTGEWLD
jgi:hypothetical protein